MNWNAPKRGELITCETVAAIVLHVRIVGDEGIKLNGHSTKPRSLCGDKVDWDTMQPVTAVTCRDCIAAMTSPDNPAFENTPGEVKQNSPNAPVSVKVTPQGTLRIELGVNTLARATMRSSYAWHLADETSMLMPGTTRPDTLFKISDSEGFARDVAAALVEEEEDGSSLLTNLFDEAGENAIEQGSEYWVDFEEEASKKP